MKHLRDGAEEVGDFSVSFGDMVFGLLFFFFVLSLVMVFNRPDVRKFQEEQNQLLRRLQSVDADRSRKERELEHAEKRIAELQKERRKLFDDSSTLAQAIKEKENTISSLEKDKESLNSRLRSVQGRVTGQDTARLENRVAALEAEVARLTERNRNLETSLAKIRSERDRMAATLDETATRLRKSGNNPDALAAIEKRQNEAAKAAKPKSPGKKPEKAGKEDAPPPETIEIQVRMVDSQMLDVAVRSGKHEILDISGTDPATVIRLAKEAQSEFSEREKSIDKADREKLRPRILLMAHPDIPYGKVEEFIRTIRTILPVTIQEWTDG